ncbi:hypothetical protein NQ314_002083 [Rhamnusium bicolor]|uniref:Uncharacterized protein n=1 Tax=Rhamnusium bicolor TaxID=1586634 RepID=A0AAV8ZRC1_9CUCU|nr:hypothetical protein NQ314_002083 [Rhamnusium bicolor]
MGKSRKRSRSPSNKDLLDRIKILETQLSKQLKHKRPRDESHMASSSRIKANKGNMDPRPAKRRRLSSEYSSSFRALSPMANVSRSHVGSASPRASTSRDGRSASPRERIDTDYARTASPMASTSVQDTMDETKYSDNSELEQSIDLELQNSKLSDEILKSLGDNPNELDKDCYELHEQIKTRWFPILSKGQALNSLICGRSNSNILMPILGDMGRLLTDFHYKFSLQRRAFLQNNLKRNISEVIKDNPVHTLLFGNNLQDQIKISNEVEKSTSQIKRSDNVPKNFRNLPHYKEMRQQKVYRQVQSPRYRPQKGGGPRTGSIISTKGNNRVKGYKIPFNKKPYGLSTCRMKKFSTKEEGTLRIVLQDLQKKGAIVQAKYTKGQ